MKNEKPKYQQARKKRETSRQGFSFLIKTFRITFNESFLLLLKIVERQRYESKMGVWIMFLLSEDWKRRLNKKGKFMTICRSSCWTRRWDPCSNCGEGSLELGCLLRATQTSRTSPSGAFRNRWLFPKGSSFRADKLIWIKTYIDEIPVRILRWLERLEILVDLGKLLVVIVDPEVREQIFGRQLLHLEAELIVDLSTLLRRGDAFENALLFRFPFDVPWKSAQDQLQNAVNSRDQIVPTSWNVASKDKSRLKGLKFLIN